jgi:hypothetical protein
MSCRLPRLLLGCLLLATSLGASSSRAQVDLEGTWYVLIHYQDSLTPNPEAWRWEDRVWVFESQGGRLEWTEYPIVVFDNESGRFEQGGTNRMSRVVAAWQPDPGQLEDIRDGLKVNSRGSKKKTLRSDDGGQSWRSSGSAAAASASFITYTENWSIEGLPQLPTFARDDVLGSATSDSLEGRTEYRSEEVLEDGELLVGSFVRDENRRGSFKMMRSGAPSGVGSRSQAERQREVFLDNLSSDDESRQMVRRQIERDTALAGLTLPEAELDELVDQAFRYLGQGKSQAEVGELIQEQLRERAASGELDPPGKPAP